MLLIERNLLHGHFHPVQMASRAKPRSFCSASVGPFGIRSAPAISRRCCENAVCMLTTRRSSAGCSALLLHSTNARGRISATCNDSWRVEETYIKLKKVWMDLSRAVDSQGNPLEFLLSPTRAAQAAKRFVVKALHATAGAASRAGRADEKETEALRSTESATCPAASEAGSAGSTPNPLPLGAAVQSVPRVINVEKHAAYPQAIAELKARGVLPESVELTSASSISTTWSNKFIASSNGSPNQRWASFRWRRQGEPCKATR